MLLWIRTRPYGLASSLEICKLTLWFPQSCHLFVKGARYFLSLPQANPNFFPLAALPTLQPSSTPALYSIVTAIVRRRFLQPALQMAAAPKWRPMISRQVSHHQPHYRHTHPPEVRAKQSKYSLVAEWIITPWSKAMQNRFKCQDNRNQLAPTSTYFQSIQGSNCHATVSRHRHVVREAPM